jgi:GNAT superfamily N-acetyltransferase
MALSLDPTDQHLHLFGSTRSRVTVRVAIAALDREQLHAFATTSFATPLLTQLFDMPSQECVLRSDCIDEWLDRGTHIVAERDGRIIGMLTVAPFDAVGMELGDANLLEIGLLCSGESGLGRLMLALALREADQRNCDGIVLELLAGRHNKPAFQLYHMFGFQHERRLDENATASSRDADADYVPPRTRAPRLQRRGSRAQKRFWNHSLLFDTSARQGTLAVSHIGAARAPAAN